ncbi:MAG: HEPN domain-containing protein [Chloroflexi bacterium]|nr:HEPN domain-containing protein [Chloroflexota bacterium]
MTRKVKDYLARASLDNLKLPDRKIILEFSGFSIKQSPNCLRDVTITEKDGTQVTIPHYQDDDEYNPGFPKCKYYLELKIGEINLFDFDEAQNRITWALNRLRLFKPGLLWGTLYGIYDPEDHPAGCYEFKRAHEEGPYPAHYRAGFDGYFVIEESEVNALVNFVNGLENVNTDSFEVALRRFHLYFDRDLIQDRAIDLMVALESMFSDDPEAIAYKIALRAAHLIELEPQKRGCLFYFLKRAYKERNSVVHGRSESSWLEEKTYIPTQTNLDSLEEIVRKSLLTLLRNAQNGIILKPSNLDGHLFFDQKSQ